MGLDPRTGRVVQPLATSQPVQQQPPPGQVGAPPPPSSGTVGQVNPGASAGNPLLPGLLPPGGATGDPTIDIMRANRMQTPQVPVGIAGKGNPNFMSQFAQPVGGGKGGAPVGGTGYGQLGPTFLPAPAQQFPFALPIAPQMPVLPSGIPFIGGGFGMPVQAQPPAWQFGAPAQPIQPIFGTESSGTPKPAQSHPFYGSFGQLRPVVDGKGGTRYVNDYGQEYDANGGMIFRAL